MQGVTAIHRHNQPIDMLYKGGGEDRQMMTPEDCTFVRCHCCGKWLYVYHWNKKKPIYCEACELERTGKGKGQCTYCQEYPGNLNHWQDPKPERTGYFCIR